MLRAISIKWVRTIVTSVCFFAAASKRSLPCTFADNFICGYEPASETMQLFQTPITNYEDGIGQYTADDYEPKGERG
jgi:hypothetical protein